jgi:hypothetical protein
MLFCGTPESEVSPRNSGGPAARSVWMECVRRVGILDAYDKVGLGASLFCLVLAVS